MTNKAPIFIPTEGIKAVKEHFGNDRDEGQTDIEPIEKQLTGYRVNDIYCAYSWTPNGRHKGFSQTLACSFDGSEPEFNYMMRMMQDNTSRFVVLLPRDKMPYLVFNAHQADVVFDGSMTTNQMFFLECHFGRVPFPYFKGSVNVKDCSVKELMNKMYHCEL